MFYIFRSGDNQYLVVEVFQIADNVFSAIRGTHKSLDKAQKHITLLEDVVPVNSMGGGNIATFDPLIGRIKRILRGKRRGRKGH